jgi:hypothetical protein
MHMQDEEEELDRLYSILYNLLIEPVEKYLERIPSNYNLVIIPHEVKYKTTILIVKHEGALYVLPS